MQVRQTKVFIVAITLVTFLVVIHMFYQSYGNLSLFDDIDEKIKMFHEEDEKLTATAPLVTSNWDQRKKFKIPVRGEKNIIFLETSCIRTASGFQQENAQLILNEQKACAIESASTTNPSASIYLFYSCPLDYDGIGRSSALVKRLFQKANVYVWHQSLSTLFQDTPLDALYKSGKIQNSMYPTTHASDVLRFFMLWRFGGIYLDLDFIVMRSLDALGPNFAGIESPNQLNSAALGLSTQGLGKEIAEDCVESLSEDFRGDDWGYNGPGLISRVLKKRCGTEKTELMTKQACDGFVVLPTTTFYPIFYDDWRLYYNESESDSTMSKINGTTALHLWNSMKVLDPNQVPVTIKKGSRQPLVLLQREYCPMVHAYGLPSGDSKGTSKSPNDSR